MNITEHVAGKDAPNVYYDDDAGVWVYRASALGTCPRALVQHRLGHPAEPVPQMMAEKFEQGKVAEPTIRKILSAKYGWTSVGEEAMAEYGPLDADGQPLVQLHAGTAVVRAHPDDIAVRVKAQPKEEWGVGTWAVVEIKALSEGMFDQWVKDGPGFMASYDWQLAVQMHATGLPGLHVVGVKDAEGKVLSDRVYVHHQAVPPKSFTEIVMRLHRIERDAVAVEEGTKTLDDIECEKCWPCGFYTRPGNACAKREAEALDHETETRACSIAQAYREARENEARWKTRAGELSVSMVELLGAKPRTVVAGSYEVVVNVPSRGGVQWKQVAEKYMPELSDGELDAYRTKPPRPSIVVNKKENQE